MFESSTARARALLARWTGEKDDEAARQRGWEIEHRRFGTRAYRDPRLRTRDLSGEAELAHVADGGERR
jgi:hypothetical protein